MVVSLNGVEVRDPQSCLIGFFLFLLVLVCELNGLVRLNYLGAVFPTV